MCSLKEDIPTVIFEKMPEETSHGAAISLSMNALRLLDRLDIYTDLKDQSFIHSADLNSRARKGNILISNTRGFDNTSANIDGVTLFQIPKSRWRNSS